MYGQERPCHSMWLFYLRNIVRIQAFIRFSPWWDPQPRHFVGYSSGTSRKKASTIFYGTAKSRRFQGGANRRRNSMTIAMDTFRQHPSARKTSHPFPPLRGGLLRRPAYLMLGEANRGTASDGADRTYTDGPRAPSVPGRRRRQRQPLNPHCPQHLRHAHREHLYAGPTRYGIPWLTVCSSSTWKRKRTATAPLCHT